MAEIELTENPTVLELRYGTANLEAAPQPESQRRAQTTQYWTNWLAGLQRTKTAPELVQRSALTLRALCYTPTGGIIAAPTTSLPESLGGARNWDYRYVWIRDAAVSATALASLGSYGEAIEFLDWLGHVLAGCNAPEQLHPLYTVEGTNLPPEAEIRELSGYAGSRPVRIGNAAAGQVQLDVFGPVVDLIHRLVVDHAPVSADHMRLVQAMVDAIATRWQEPDHGIWEVRGPRRHWVHSKVMCWLAVDRAIAVARRLLDESRPNWERLRTRIAEDVLQNGYNPDLGAFTSFYGGDEVDAATLQLGLSGLLETDDPRWRRTVEAIEAQLRVGDTVYRYHFDDGLAGEEGGFHLCTAWLADAWITLGDRARAQQLFSGLCAAAGPTGLLPEEIDPRTLHGLGNHPQAYSHAALIQTARHLDGHPVVSRETLGGERL